MSIYQLKSSFQGLLRPATRRLARAGVTANQVTVSAAVLSLLCGGLIYTTEGAAWTLLLLPVALFVRMALNAIDGMLAREHAMQSRLGTILNELGDVLSDAALYLPLATLPAFPARLVVVIVVLAVISEMTGVLAVLVGSARRYDGPMGKSDRAFVFGLLGLLLGLGVPPAHWLVPALWIVLTLLILTIVNRAARALRRPAP